MLFYVFSHRILKTRPQERLFLLKRLLQRSDREVKVARGQRSHTRRCCEKPCSCIFFGETGGWEEDIVEDRALFLMVFLGLHLWYGFTASGKTIVPLGAEEFGVSSKKVLQNISEHRRDTWCVYCGYTTFPRDIVTFVSFLFPAFHLTCHVFPVNSAPHSFPCQLNADDFQPLRRTIKETFHGKRPEHRARFAHKSVNTKSVNSSALSMQEFPLQLQFTFHDHIALQLVPNWWPVEPKDVWPTQKISQILFPSHGSHEVHK